MSKLFKIALALVILIVVALGVLLWSINPILESLKPKITKAISQQIKQDVELGKISAQFFPSVAIKIQNVGLVNKKDAASVGTLLLDTSLGDLIKGKVKINEITLSSVNLKITREKDNSISLADIPLTGKQKSKPSSTDKKTTSTPQTKKDTAPAKTEDKTSLSLKVTKISADDINIYITDKAVEPAQEINLTNAGFEAFGISADGTGDFSFNADLLGTTANNLKISGKSTSEKTALGLPKASIVLSLSDLDLKKISELTKAYGVGVEGLVIDKSLSINAEISTTDQGLNIDYKLDASDSLINFANSFVKTSGLPLTVAVKAQPRANGTADISNFQLKLAGIDIGSSASLGVNAISSKTKINTLPLSDLASFAPMLKDFALKGDISGNISSDISLQMKDNPVINSDFKFSEIGANLSGTELAKLNGVLKIENKDGNNNLINLDLKPATLAGVPFGPTELRGNLNQKSLDLSKLKVAIFDGGLDGTANLATPFSPGAFKSNFALKNVSLEKLSLSLFPSSPYKLKGILEELKANLNTNIAKDPVASLTAQSNFLASKGSIAGTNILKQTLEKVDSIPGVQAALIKYIPEDLNDLLSKNETAFDLIEARSSVSNKTINLEKLTLSHSAYEITANGSMTFDSSLNLLAKLILSEEASEKIALKEAKVKLLFDNQNRITIPIRIKKSSDGKPVVVPDLGDLTKRALQNTAKEAISRELQKGGGKGIGGKLLKSLF